MGGPSTLCTAQSLPARLGSPGPWRAVTGVALEAGLARSPSLWNISISYWKASLAEDKA